MATDSEIISIEILGIRLQLRGGDNPSEVRQVAEYVRERAHDLARSTSPTPALKIALLTAIHIADEMLQQSKNDDQLIDSATEKAHQILSKSSET